MSVAEAIRSGSPGDIPPPILPVDDAADEANDASNGGEGARRRAAASGDIRSANVRFDSAAKHTNVTGDQPPIVRKEESS